MNLSRRLLAAGEQKLHAEADAEARKPLGERRDDLGAGAAETLSRGAECPDSRKHEGVGVEHRPRLPFHAHRRTVRLERLLQRV